MVEHADRGFMAGMRDVEGGDVREFPDRISEMFKPTKITRVGIRTLPSSSPTETMWGVRHRMIGSTGAPASSGWARQVFSMTWLWSIFAGFYLVAYAFWVPGITHNIFAVVLLIAASLALGAGLLLDGFSRALKLQGGGTATLTLPLTRPRRAAGGILLLAFLAVYIPASGRIVAHWPLDFAITLLAGGMMLVYAIAGTE